MKNVIFDVEAETELGKNASPAEIADFTVSNVRPGSIVLLHVESKKRANSLAALRLILPRLRKKGYRFLTVSELLKENQESSSRRSVSDSLTAFLGNQ